MSNLGEAITHLMMTRSALCATGILDAWRENDQEQLNRELAKGSAPEFAFDENCHERERLELLDGIATEIKSSIASGRDAGVYLGLLRHLAKPAVMPLTRSCVC
jgi:hypothetical protein